MSNTMQSHAPAPDAQGVQNGRNNMNGDDSNIVDEILNELKSQGGDITVTDKLKPQLENADVIYMTRIQKERFPDEDEYVRVAGIYKLIADDLSSAKDDMIVMHPLPRVDEIDPDVDSTRHAAYFEQAFNGVVARMALLCDMLNVTIPTDIGGGN